MQRIVIFGNSGSGKSTLARKRADQLACAYLDLDTVAWQPGVHPPTRRPLADSQRDIDAFLQRETNWVIEGCYASLLSLVVPAATEVLFLNPGVATCQANCRARPWEPHKYETAEQQDANLPALLTWVAAYETRTDEFSLRAHRALFDAFDGDKTEFTSNVPQS